MADVIIAMPKGGPINNQVQLEENKIEEKLAEDASESKYVNPEYPNNFFVQIDKKDFTEDIRSKILDVK